MTSKDRKYEPKILTFNGAPDDGFQLWSYGVEAALESRELGSAVEKMK